VQKAVEKVVVGSQYKYRLGAMVRDNNFDVNKQLQYQFSYVFPSASAGILL